MGFFKIGVIFQDLMNLGAGIPEGQTPYFRERPVPQMKWEGGPPEFRANVSVSVSVLT